MLVKLEIRLQILMERCGYLRDLGDKNNETAWELEQTPLSAAKALLHNEHEAQGAARGETPLAGRRLSGTLTSP
jgi:hypothetical protein